MNDLAYATLQWLNDSTSQGILTTDTDLRICGWNNWLEIHSGYKASEVVGRQVFEIYPELVTRHLDAWYYQALEGHVTVLAQRLHHYLFPMPADDSQSEFGQMQQSAQIAPLRIGDRIVGTITVIEDVTEREARERILRRQIAAMEAIHEVSQGILSLRMQDCLQRVVDITASLFRATTVAVALCYGEQVKIEASNRPIETLDNSRVNLNNSPAQVVIRSSQPLFVADLNARPEVIPLDPYSRCLIATPLIAEQSVIGALLIESDQPHALSKFNHRKALMLATQAAIGIRNAQIYREAQEAIHIRDTFLSIASHELKTPLTTILGNAQILQRRAQREQSLNARDSRTLDVIVSQSIRLNRMVAALLDVSRIETGQLSIERNRLDVVALAHRVVNDIQSMFEQHEIQLEAPDTQVFVEGDELRLEQVFQNLLQNAVKYSPYGGLIVMEIEQNDSHVQVHICDHGIGIPSHAIPQLFQRFYRADNVLAQQISGIGVGLFVVKEIIDLHGGQIDIDSVEGQGSTFTVTLPLAV
jgi:signal transduction histidine kinase